MKIAALILAGLALVTGCLWFADRNPIMSIDDPTWFNRSVRLPYHCRAELDYFSAVDIPALNRWCYGAALRATGHDKLPSPMAYGEGMRLAEARRNLARWRIARPAEITMRAVNAVFFTGGLLLLWWAACLVLGSRWLAALTLAPLAFSWPLGVVMIKLGPDAFLVFGLALTLALWQYFHMRGRGPSWRSVILVGLAAGLATSAKHNGGLALIAFAAYLALHSRGRDRLAKPLAACAAAFAVFCLVNPVVLFSGRMPWTVIRDILARRFEVMAAVNDDFGNYGRLEIIGRAVPFLVYMPLVVAVVAWALRRVRALEPAVWWLGVIFVGTVFTINAPNPWYVAPAQLTLYFVSGLSFLALLASYVRSAAPVGASVGDTRSVFARHLPSIDAALRKCGGGGAPETTPKCPDKEPE